LPGPGHTPAGNAQAQKKKTPQKKKRAQRTIGPGPQVLPHWETRGRYFVPLPNLVDSLIRFFLLPCHLVFRHGLGSNSALAFSSIFFSGQVQGLPCGKVIEIPWAASLAFPQGLLAAPPSPARRPPFVGPACFASCPNRFTQNPFVVRFFHNRRFLPVNLLILISSFSVPPFSKFLSFVFFFLRKNF